MLGRRGFLKAIGAGVLGLSLALRLPERDESYLPSIEDREIGISVRFIRQWDLQSSQQVNRFDVFMGAGDLEQDALVLARHGFPGVEIIQ